MNYYDDDSKNSTVSNDTNIYIIIGFLSFAILAFLFWLIFLKTGIASVGDVSWVNSLPAVNAFLNTLTSLFLITGLVSIKRNKIKRHKQTMFLATLTSALFLVSYITYHYCHGDTTFIGTGVLRPIYFGILFSHVSLSVILVPLILSTLYLALIKNFVKHKKVAKITFPIWLYVSVTGVLIFTMLKYFNR